MQRKEGEGESDHFQVEGGLRMKKGPARAELQGRGREVLAKGK